MFGLTKNDVEQGIINYANYVRFHMAVNLIKNNHQPITLESIIEMVNGFVMDYFMDWTQVELTPEETTLIELVKSNSFGTLTHVGNHSWHDLETACLSNNVVLSKWILVDLLNRHYIEEFEKELCSLTVATGVNNYTDVFKWLFLSLPFIRISRASFLIVLLDKLQQANQRNLIEWLWLTNDDMGETVFKRFIEVPSYMEHMKSSVVEWVFTKFMTTVLTL
jgi:hypothetical protein